MPGSAETGNGRASSGSTFSPYGIGYGARMLAPLFRRPVAWRVLDILVGCTMWAIAGSLALGRKEAAGREVEKVEAPTSPTPPPPSSIAPRR